MIPRITRYPALLIHENKHCRSYYLIDNKETYLETLFYLFKDIYKMHKNDYGFVRNINVDLFNQEDAQKFPWRYWKNVHDICAFYFESYQLAKKEESHSLVEKLGEEKFKKPEFWRNSCLFFLFAYFGDEIEIDYFEKIEENV